MFFYFSDTNLIKNIIRFSKGNLERVKLKYEMYVVAKTNLKDIYSNRIYGPDSYKESQAYRLVMSVRSQSVY